MRVLHVITGDAWAGAEAQVWALIVALAQRGVQEQVVTFNSGSLVNRLRDASFRVHTIAESECGLSSLVAGCGRVIARFQPDIVHVHGFKENLVGGIAARLNGVKVVRTHHGKGMIGAAFRYEAVERVNARLFSDALIAVSQDLERFLAKHRFPEKKITVVLNGVSPLQASPPERIVALKGEFGLPRDCTVIGTVGRLVPVKDHATFLRGARAIQDREPRTRFVIVGDGPLMSNLVQEAEALGIRQNVVFTGFRENAASLGEAFDVFGLTSRHEGVPMALLEAMSLGTPVVATRVGGVAEIITNGVNGLLVPASDPVSFARACLEILHSESLRSGLSQRCAADTRGRFSVDACAHSTHALYQRVVTT